MLTTGFGLVECVVLRAQQVHRVGFRPFPWDWTPWEYAVNGRCQGRWDDPAGVWRTLYLGSSALACYLEVLAPFRPDPELQTDMDEIVSNDDDDHFPTVAPGRLPYAWCDQRRVCSAKLTGRFALPGHRESLATLRKRFLTLAKRLGLKDVDGAAIRDTAPRDLTQAISAWIYRLIGTEDEQVDGIQYLSRHGDEFTLWAIYEREEAASSPPQLSDRATPVLISPDDADLAEAMKIHGLTLE